MEKEITITIDNGVSYAIADITCWLKGFLAARNEKVDEDCILRNAASKLEDLNVKLQREMGKQKEGRKDE